MIDNEAGEVETKFSRELIKKQQTYKLKRFFFFFLDFAKIENKPEHLFIRRKIRGIISPQMDDINR